MNQLKPYKHLGAVILGLLAGFTLIGTLCKGLVELLSSLPTK